MTTLRNHNARPLSASGLDRLATRREERAPITEDRTMAGNRNSGRRPTPPTPEDSLSELLLELQGQIVEMEAADRRHAREQRARRRMACHVLERAANGWRDLRGLYPTSPAQDTQPQSAEVIPFPTRRRPEPPTTPIAVAA